MKRATSIFFIFICTVGQVFSGNGLGNSYGNLRLPMHFSENGAKASRFNIKIQPAIFWATLGIEAEYIISPKITMAINVLGKIGRTDNKNNFYPIKQEEFLNNGYMAELIGRYFIQLSKKKILLAPTGFYIQAAVGYSKMLYFDGNTRPFTLHSRVRKSDDPRKPNDFSQPYPIIGGLGAGYQLELVPHKVIANLLLGTQTNFDDKGVFFSIYVSPSVGLMF